MGGKKRENRLRKAKHIRKNEKEARDRVALNPMRTWKGEKKRGRHRDMGVTRRGKTEEERRQQRHFVQ